MRVSDAELTRLEEYWITHDPKVAVSFNLYGYKNAKLTPPANDELTVSGVLMQRVVLTPESPQVNLTLAGGREIQIQAWANKGIDWRERQDRIVLDLIHDLRAARAALASDQPPETGTARDEDL